MSINLDKFKKENPNLKNAYTKLQDWFDKNPNVKIVSAKTLGKEISDINSIDLAVAFWKIGQDENFAKQIFKLIKDDEFLNDVEYNCPSEFKNIPENIDFTICLKLKDNL